MISPHERRKSRAFCDISAVHQRGRGARAARASSPRARSSGRARAGTREASRASPRRPVARVSLFAHRARKLKKPHHLEGSRSLISQQLPTPTLCNMYSDSAALHRHAPARRRLSRGARRLRSAPPPPPPPRLWPHAPYESSTCERESKDRGWSAPTQTTAHDIRPTARRQGQCTSMRSHMADGDPDRRRECTQRQTLAQP